MSLRSANAAGAGTKNTSTNNNNNNNKNGALNTASRLSTAGPGSTPRNNSNNNNNGPRNSPTPAVRGWGSPHANSSNANNSNANSNNGVSAATTATAFPSLSGAKKDTSPAAAKMKERTLFVLVSLIGNTVVATTKDKRKYVGVLQATTNTDNADLGVSLTSAQEFAIQGAPSNTLGPPMKLLVINPADLDTVEAHDVVLGEPLKADATPTNGFRTDVEISAREAAADERLSQGRTLTAWSDDTTANDLNNSLDAPSKAAGGAWDQFAANEARFGVKSNYDEDMYTTKLDRSRVNFKEEEKKAERLAAEIMGQASTNTHMAEERGQVDDSGQNEEDKYGAVVRSPGAYVPPAARKAAAANNETTAANLAATASPRLNLPEAKVEQQKPAATDKDKDKDKDKETSSSSSVPGIAVKVPTPTKTTTAANPVSSTSVSPNTSASASQTDSIRDFHQFVASEKMRVQNQKLAAREQQKRAMITREQNENNKRQTLNDLKAWSSSFKLKTPVPEDVASQKKAATPAPTSASAQKSLSPTTAHTQSSALNKTGSTPGHSSVVPSPSGGAGSASAVAAGGDATAAKSVSFAGNQKDRLAESKAMLAKMTIPKIPPYKAKTPQTATTTTATPAASGQPSKPSPAASSSGASPSASAAFKMSAKASTFKPFNPAAASFTPGAAATSSAAGIGGAAPAGGLPSSVSTPAHLGGLAARPSLSGQPQPAAPINPFFGARVLKLSPVPIHVRDDFNPFKTGKVPDPSSVSPDWPYNGKSYQVLMASRAPSGPVDAPPPPPSQHQQQPHMPLHHHHHHPHHHHHQQQQQSDHGQIAGAMLPPTPLSQHQSAHGTPQSQSSGQLGPQSLGASPGPIHHQQQPLAGLQQQHPGHPVQQGQPPFGMVYQPAQGPGGPGPYRFPPQQPMQGQYMVHGVPGMGMPVGVGMGGPPMAYGAPGPGMPQQPNMAPPPQFMGPGGHHQQQQPQQPHGGHHHHPQQQHHHHHQQPQQPQPQQQPHPPPLQGQGGGPHHAPPPHPGVALGLAPHQMHFGSPQMPPQQHQPLGAMQGGPIPGPGTPHVPPQQQQQQQQQQHFHHAASPQIGQAQPRGGSNSPANVNGGQPQQQQPQQGGPGARAPPAAGANNNNSNNNNNKSGNTGNNKQGAGAASGQASKR
ncbi:unnamed protein product [Sympodiomycopsis kandeliae]